MVLALIVLGIALQLVLIARARYQRLADEALIQDRGMQALDLIGRSVRQAGWLTDTPASSPTRRWPDAGAPPSLFGWDNCANRGALFSTECPPGAEGWSDALLVRFAGRSKNPNGSDGDGATVDCEGGGVRERMKGDDDPRAGRMLLYVSRSTDAEQTPQLICVSLSRRSETPAIGRSNGMVRGIETLQLLYSLAPTGTLPAQTLPARAMQTDDWYRVQEVHVAIVVQGNHVSLRKPASDTIALFPGLEAISGAVTEDTEYRPRNPRLHRTRFTATFAVRNPLRCGVDAC